MAERAENGLNEWASSVPNLLKNIHLLSSDEVCPFAHLYPLSLSLSVSWFWVFFFINCCSLSDDDQSVRR